MLVKMKEVNGEQMNYYQGMHDVAGTFLLTLDQNLAFHCIDVASRFLLTDYLQLPFDVGLIPLFQLALYLLEKIDKELYMLVSDDGLQPTPIFATSWTLTIFSHDVENFACVQRLFDVVLASHPLMIIYLICACILIYKEELYENAEEFQSSVCFFVFKAPLLKLNDLEQVEKIIERASEIEKEIPIGVLLTEAKAENGIVVNERDTSPFTQAFNGQLLQIQEAEESLKDRENSLLFYYERQRQKREIERREKELLEQRRLEAISQGIDPDAIDANEGRAWFNSYI